MTATGGHPASERLGSPIYNSMWRLRRDSWSSLQEACSQLAASHTAADSLAGLWVARARELLATLAPMEHYWAFPGWWRFAAVQRLLSSGDYARLDYLVSEINRSLATESYRRGAGPSDEAGGSGTTMDTGDTWDTGNLANTGQRRSAGRARPYFEVLVVNNMTQAQEQRLREQLRRLRRDDDEFVYELVVVPSFADAVIAVLFNFNLQACMIRPPFTRRTSHDLSALGVVLDEHLTERADPNPAPVASVHVGPPGAEGGRRAVALGRRLHQIRPELDLYLMAEVGVEELAGELDGQFRRVFHAREGALELHLSVLRGIAHRYQAPFFAALRTFSRQPTGVFHALPVSRGRSVVDSHWISEMVDFYGLEIFLAETSATCGGLDSLLEPTGPLREAQQLAAETFGARRSFWVTNGTSTANKIVVQALVRPGDIVLVDRNCHQSHHYGLVLAGAQVRYLDAYPRHEYGMYGAVPLREIKRTLLALRRAGRLDQVKMLMLTNCTFDGIVYDVERVMAECLAIKPDLVFLWDEAWFAFARFHPVYRTRTAMAAAQNLLDRLRDPAYEQTYIQHRTELTSAITENGGPAHDSADEGDEALLDTRLLDTRLWPDPARARVRVYATQSTHKTLTSLRQGSMIHVFDQDYDEKVAETFHEAYMAHTSTSPNYQILASLDLGRRQAALEGPELVQRQVECAMNLRDAIDNHPLLRRYVRCLTTADLIPAAYRPAAIAQPLRSGLTNMMAAWREDEFVLDPCRITLFIGDTGIEGDTFKREYLMDRFGVQVNKTTRNTVLFMTNIGTTRSAVAYLIEVLTQIVTDLDNQLIDQRPRTAIPVQPSSHHSPTNKRPDELTKPAAPLPNFSAFHPAFRTHPDSDTDPATGEGDIRRAYFTAYDEDLCEYLTADQITTRLAGGEQVVSATFVTPYPPGFPVLVPGQCFSTEILTYMNALDTPEIHGYHPENGYRVFTDKVLQDTKKTSGQP